jgi:hypothetical protein
VTPVDVEMAHRAIDILVDLVVVAMGFDVCMLVRQGGITGLRKELVVVTEIECCGVQEKWLWLWL